MSNWYKIAFRGNIPTNEDTDKRLRNPYIPNPQMTPGDEKLNPSSFGGKERKGYPKGLSQYEGSEDEKVNNDMPKQDNLMDNAPEAEYSYNVTERFSDPIDQLKDPNYKEPVGALNMPHGNNMDIYKKTKERSRLKGLNFN